MSKFAIWQRREDIDLNRYIRAWEAPRTMKFILQVLGTKIHNNDEKPVFKKASKSINVAEVVAIMMKASGMQ